MNDVLRGWKTILAGRTPFLSIEITKECPLTCPGCYAYGDEHLGGGTILRQVSDFRGKELVDGVMGLVDALDQLNRELSHPGVIITFTHESVPPALPPDLTICLFRIAQEALHNALKHSSARNVSVDLTGVSDRIALTIVDDGVGFDVDAAWRRGLGLISVRERVEAIGGTFELRSSPGAGTRLEVSVPVPVSHDTNTVAV